MNASLNALVEHKSPSCPCDFPQLPQVSVLLQTAIRGQETCLSSTDPKDTVFIPPLICFLAGRKHSMVKVCLGTPFFPMNVNIVHTENN